jgi:hypothetical protein
MLKSLWLWAEMLKPRPQRSVFMLRVLQEIRFCSQRFSFAPGGSTRHTRNIRDMILRMSRISESSRTARRGMVCRDDAV